MKSKYIAFTSTLLLVACGMLTPTPDIQATSMPTTEESAPSPVEIVTTEPVNDPNYFRDDFDTTLDAGWQWQNEDANNWSLETVPGMLLINVAGGQVSDETIQNLLLRPAPRGNFQIETKVSFRPNADYQFAGLVVYESPPNLIQAGRAFCNLPDVCVGEGLYVDYYNNGNFVTPNFAAPFTDSDVYLRLLRQGDTYTFQSSSNGSEWILRGGTVSTMNPIQIGLVAGQNTVSPIPALFDYFDYFEVRSLP
jgi:arabinan endo-1,5-alpha-L-arabinosidase